jgi:hypothetical protein
MRTRSPNTRQPVRPGRGAIAVLSLFLALQVALHFFLPVLPARAQESGNRAGLVIVYPGGRVATRCVAFDEPAISGYVLLQRSTLPFATASGPTGVQVCSVNGEGCPATDCWCQCKSAPCAYWNYFHGNPDGSWAYANVGVASRSLGHGDVDAWMWGDGSGAPPALSFSSICEGSGGVAPPPLATATLVPADTPAVPSPVAEATPAPTATELSPMVLPTATPSPTVASTPIPSSTTDAEIISSSTPGFDTVTPAPEPTAGPTAAATATAVPTVTETSTLAASATETPSLALRSPESTEEAGAEDASSTQGGYLAFAGIVVALGAIFLFARHRQGG